MALVHDQLYTSKDLKYIDIPDFIQQLTDEIQINMYNEVKPVRIVLDTIPVRFNFNLLIPLGMLINEIVSNSFKHAFKDVDEPEINIRLYMENENCYALSIRDNGIGVPEHVFQNAETTGFIIIDALIHQIDADLLINIEKGTEFKLLLPADKVETKLITKKVKKSIKNAE
jgi:two-component sensor histidine kinase